MHSGKEKQEQMQRSCEFALLTRKERDWLLGNLELSKPYGYRLKSSIKRKIRTFVDFELPLLIKNNLFVPIETKSHRLGFGDGTYSNNSSLGKAKVLGPNPSQGLPLFRNGVRNKTTDNIEALQYGVKVLTARCKLTKKIEEQPIVG